MSHIFGIPFLSLLFKGNGFSLIDVGERDIGNHGLLPTPLRGFGQRDQILFHIPVGYVKDLGTFGLFFFGVIANYPVNGPAFGGEFFDQIFIVIFLPANLFPILTDGAGQVEVTGGAYV
jgi:hypothetical protein